jgi:hypothetical protein
MEWRALDPEQDLKRYNAGPQRSALLRHTKPFAEQLSRKIRITDAEATEPVVSCQRSPSASVVHSAADVDAAVSPAVSPVPTNRPERVQKGRLRNELFDHLVGTG